MAVLSISCAKNSTAKTKPKRQLESIRSPENLQYSLVLPHSRVTQFRSLTSERRISNLPPYAVQMEPVVQYSQKDPLYDPNLDNLDDAFVNQNELLYAQPKILNLRDQTAEHTYGQPYGSLPTAPLYSHEPPAHYYDAPEPIIEIIIKESNESLPSPPLPPPQKKKKEPVHVFYVKYSKDPHNKDKVVYEKPIPAITPPSNEEEHHGHHNDYVTVTPEPYYAPLQTTTLRAIIKPESEIYHSDSNVKISFGNEGHHYNSDRRESHLHSEDHEESAPKPAIAYPQQEANHPPLERSASPKPKPQQQPRQQSHQQPHSHSQPQQHQPRHQEVPRLPSVHPTQQTYRLVPQHAQSRIQFQPSYLANEQQLPRQGPSVSPFRVQSHIPRQNPFGLSQNPTPHFPNSGPTVPGPAGPPFSNTFTRPSNGPSFHARPSNPPSFGPHPNLNGPPRPGFHSGPQRPFHQPQPSQFFDEPKYLQENYHTITTDQVDPTKEQLLPNRQRQTFNLGPRPNPNPNTAHYQEDTNRPQIVPVTQQLPQQRPHQHFTDSAQNKPSFSLGVGPSRPPFFNLKPSPPQIDDNRHVFQQHQAQPPQQPPFSFHPGPRPTPEQQHTPGQGSFLGPIAASPSPSAIPQTQFLPQPSAPTLFNFHPQPSPTPEQQFSFQSSERPQFSRPHGPSERPPLHQSHGPSERPPISAQDQFHQQNVGQFVPNGGELVASIPKYEQHITVSSPSAQPNYSGLNEPTPTASQPEQQYHQHQQNQQHQQHQQNQQHQQHQQIQQQQQHQQNQQHPQRPQQQLQPQQVQQQQQFLDPEQEQVRFQLAQNVKKQQEEIQRLQSQLLLAQQQHQQQEQQQVYKHSSKFSYNQQIQATSPRSYTQERSQQPTYVNSTPPPYYQSTSRTIENNPTTQKYLSSTLNSINSAPEDKKEDRKKLPTIQLPDEVPDDLRQQLLSSGILDNADISILDYDKVGDTPLDSLPPDQLANFFSAGGGQQLAASENRPVVVSPEGERIQSRIDDEEEDDQEIAASENVPSYVAPSQKQAVEMKVVHFDPKTAKGQSIAKEYVKDGATRVDPVALNDKKYNRYLPLKVSGNQFPLPDILKGRKITSVVVLAPVETDALNGDHNREERSASNGLKGIKFIVGDSLQDLLKKPTKENYEKWLDTEKKTATDLQSVVLLVTG